MRPFRNLEVTAAVEPGNVGVIVGHAFDLVADKVDDNGVPTALRVFPFPTYETDDGVYVTDDESQALIVWWWRKRGIDIVVDYEHQTLTGGEAPAAGFAKRLVAGGRAGLIATDLDWNARAYAYLQHREYRYHSPVYYYDLQTRR